MAGVIDNLVAARILYLLVLPFNKWEAYKDGIIDDEGKRTEKEVEKSENWTMLHRLVSRLKVLLGKIPGGKSQIASIAAAYLLVRECVEHDKEPELLESFYMSIIESDLAMTLENYNFVTDTLTKIFEDGEGVAPANVTANVDKIELPLGKKPKKKIKNGQDSGIPEQSNQNS